MTPDGLFQIANPVALLGWIILTAAIFLNRPFWRDTVAGLALPLALSAAYTTLIAISWWSAEGGYGSLADVQRLFTSPWIALAGWVHYLAFDIFIVAWLSRQFMERGVPRLLLVPVLPLTFLFGPAGFLLGQAILLSARRKQDS